ncbi:hypothetical protein, partial [Thermus antranikianii]
DAPMTAKEVAQRLRTDGVARVEGVVEPEWGHEAVWFFGSQGRPLQDFYEEEVAALLLEATARWADGPGAFTLDLEAGRVVVEVLEEQDYGYEVLRREEVSLEDFLE